MHKDQAKQALHLEEQSLSESRSCIIEHHNVVSPASIEGMIKFGLPNTRAKAPPQEAAMKKQGRDEQESQRYRSPP